MVAYTNWIVGNRINICVQIEDFCGQTSNRIWLTSSDMQKHPTGCTLTCAQPPNCPWICINTTGREVIFKAVRHYIYTNDDGRCSNVAANYIYRDLGIAISDSTGTAGIQYTVTEQDKLDYEDAIINGQTYDIVCCINDSLAYGHAEVFTGVTVLDICAGITCPDICVGNNLYSQICDPATGLCVQNTLIPPSPNPTCLNIGNISFDSNPQGAEIWLAQYPQTPIDKGVQTPNTISSLPVGTYTYVLRRFNYEDYIGTIEVLANQTVSISALMIPIPGAVYQFGIKLDNETLASYISGTLDKFTDLFNSLILSRFNILLSSVVYDSINHTITVEIEDMPSLDTGHQNTIYGATLQKEYFETLQKERLKMLRLEYPTFYDSRHISDIPQTKSLFLPLIIPILIELLPYIAILIGWAVAYVLFGGPKVVSQTQSSLQITTTMLTNDSQVVPIKDVVVEINGLKATATSSNSYTVTFQNLMIGTTYPIKAYIPLSPGSNVYQASFDGNITITDVPMNTMTISLKMDTLQQRDWKLCDLKLDSNPMPAGTIIRVFRMKTSATGTPIFDTLGTTTSGTDFCSGIVKVPAYLPDNQILTQFISNSFDPATPSPTIHSGDQIDIPTISREKNTITVATETKLKNNIIADKIEIKDKYTGAVIKSVVPTVNTTLISGIPQGTYSVVVTKTGYKTSTCSLSSCEVTFTTNYLGSASATIILESLVSTCKLTITVTDKYIKPPKTQTSISIDGAVAQIAPNGVLTIPEIIAGSHKFTIKADGYKEIIDKSETIKCTTIADSITFALDQTSDIIIGSMNMTADIGTILGQKGSIQVKKNEVITIKVSGGNAAEDIKIYNISEAPDLLVATIPAGQGLTGTTLSYDKDMTVELQAFQRCILGICAESSNVLSITVGTGSPKCAIPGPFGGCLVEQATGYGMMVLAGLGLVAAITIFGKGGGTTRIIETSIPSHRRPPQTEKEYT